MIYRIKIVKDGKFVRYASTEEMKYLRVNAEGKVEMLSITPLLATGYRENHTGLIAFAEAEHGWNDVSSTHDVEWGMLTQDKDGKPIPIYDCDIYVDWNTGLDGVSTNPSVFRLYRDYNNLHLDQFPIIEVIGNVNENPELLDVQND